tara:strand:- start:579 stop:1496 length:918 start_codon:yes stop_codon:yes gene_type:complete
LNQEVAIKIIIIFISTLFSQSIPYFDSEKAYQYIVEQCEIGPRYPGSIGQEKFRVYLTDFLSKQKADTTIFYTHIVEHPYEDKEIKLYNFLSRFNLEANNRIMLMAHWDTREIADKDPNPENHNKPILGANDGASGVAVLMVLAEIISNNELSNIGIDLLFIDGEDMGRAGDIENFCIGTTKFCEVIPYPEPRYAICLDMIADENLSLPIEYFSYIQAPFLVKEIWGLANEMGYTEFKDSLVAPIYDDHRALYLNSNIPAIDIIDFDYPYWHTLQDIPEHCSEKSLKIVGNVMCEYIYRKNYESK